MCLEKLTEVLRALSGAPRRKHFTSAIIAAGGSSERFEGTLTKQMTHICGKPLIAHTLLAFERAECIDEIIVCAKEDELEVYKALCEENGITKVSEVVVGGKTRQESIFNGLRKVSDESKYVAISDGARCLVTPEQIKEVCSAAYKYDAATAAHRSTDTVKISDDHGFIDSTTDRNTVWLAQTPQVFKTNLYRAATYTALENGYEGTDDNMLVELLKCPIKLVECGSQNIKVTTVDDIILARAVIESRLSENGAKSREGQA